MDKKGDNKEIKKLPQPPKVEVPPKKTSSYASGGQIPQKKSVVLMWFLSLITLGIYNAIWYLKKSQEFDNLGTNKKLNKKLVLTYLLIEVLLIITILILPFTVSEEMGTFSQNFTTTQTTLAIIFGVLFLIRLMLTLSLAFISRAIINEALEKKGETQRLSILFPLIFGFLYLQYEINRITDDKENNPRKGPWIWCMVLIVLIILAILDTTLNIFNGLM